MFYDKSCLIRFILEGQGSDAERSRASVRLVVMGYRVKRCEWLKEKGWWAARPMTSDVSF